jgi:multiple sugar transport system substrate-binding protein
MMPASCAASRGVPEPARSPAKSAGTAPAADPPCGSASHQLLGSSWDHPRGHAPMVATAAARDPATAGAVSIRWIPRSLHDFGIAPVESLARHHDLIVVDHPHVGAMAESDCVLPLDEFADPAVLAALAEHPPCGSQQSYQYGGHQWALAIDAACHASA